MLPIPRLAFSFRSAQCTDDGLVRRMRGEFMAKTRSIKVKEMSRWVIASIVGLMSFSAIVGVSEKVMAQAGPAVEPSADPAKAFEPREFVGTNGKALKYRLIKPMGYKFGKKYPLVLFLHGAGERGDDNASTLKHAAKDFADLERRAKYPAYVVIPQCPTDRRWSEVDWSKDASALPEEPSDPMRNIKELLDEMVENAGVDPNRIYITGLSMG
ncbi:MAG: hypothetical protein RL069_456, partial [Planctomycetota bacterium]